MPTRSGGKWLLVAGLVGLAAGAALLRRAPAPAGSSTVAPSVVTSVTPEAGGRTCLHSLLPRLKQAADTIQSTDRDPYEWNAQARSRVRTTLITLADTFERLQDCLAQLEARTDPSTSWAALGMLEDVVDTLHTRELLDAAGGPDHPEVRKAVERLVAAQGRLCDWIEGSGLPAAQAIAGMLRAHVGDVRRGAAEEHRRVAAAVLQLGRNVPEREAKDPCWPPALRILCGNHARVHLQQLFKGVHQVTHPEEQRRIVEIEEEMLSSYDGMVAAARERTRPYWMSNVTALALEVLVDRIRAAPAGRLDPALFARFEGMVRELERGRAHDGIVPGLERVSAFLVEARSRGTAP